MRLQAHRLTVGESLRQISSPVERADEASQARYTTGVGPINRAVIRSDQRSGRERIAAGKAAYSQLRRRQTETRQHGLLFVVAQTQKSLAAVDGDAADRIQAGVNLRAVEAGRGVANDAFPDVVHAAAEQAEGVSAGSLSNAVVVLTVPSAAVETCSQLSAGVNRAHLGALRVVHGQRDVPSAARSSRQGDAPSGAD